MRVSVTAEVNGKPFDIAKPMSTVNGLRIEKKDLNDGFTLFLEAKRDLEISLTVSFETEARDEIFVPALWYDGNKEGEGLFPSVKRSECWSFFETRMPLPGIIGYKKDGSWTYIYLEETKDEKALFSSGWNESAILFHLPPLEKPLSYRGKTKLVEAEERKTVRLKKGETIRREFHIREIKGSLYDSYNSLIKSIYRKEKLKSGWDAYEESKLVRLLNMVIPMGNGTAALIMGEGNGAVEDVYRFTSGSFLVKSLEAAVAFFKTKAARLSSRRVNKALHSAMERTGADSLSDIAVRIGKYFLQCATDDGFYQDSVNLQTKERGGYLGISEHPEYKHMMNARCTGEAMSSFLDLYDSTGIPEFLSLAKQTATFYLKHQLPSGSFGRWWNKDGKAVDSKGTNGAYIAVFLLRLLPYLEDKEKEKGIEAVNKAMVFYSSLSLSGAFHGDTLDADSIDKEAGVSILSFLLLCIENGYGDGKTLEAAIKAASFILTWIWQRQSYLPSDSPLGRIGFSTEGMSSVSVAHHHLDFYGMLIARLFLKLWRITGDCLWKDQAIKMMNACLFPIGCEKNGFLGRDSYFDGWQPEQLNHTWWDYFSNEKKMNGHADIDIAWVNVLGYSSLLSIKDEFPQLFATCENPEKTLSQKQES